MTLDCPALLLSPGGASIEGLVRNASISGALIETALRPPPLTMLTVALLSENAGRRRSLELPACVARQAHDSIAIEWRDIAALTLIELLREAKRSATMLRVREPRGA